MGDRLPERRAAKGLVSRIPPPCDRGIVETGLGEMVGDDFWLGRRGRWLADQDLRRAAVQRLSTALEQAVVGYVLDQRMLEAIGRLSAGPFDEQEVRVDKPIEREF